MRFLEITVTLFILAYAAGLLTIASPCIFPILPIILARADEPFRRSGLPLLIGLTLTFAVAASLASAAGNLKVKLPADVAVDTEVDLGTTGGDFFLQARLNVSLPGLAPDIARQVVDAAHQICPYSKATRGNINVAINLI